LLLAWVGGRIAGWKTAAIWFCAFCIVEFLIARTAYLCQSDGPGKLNRLAHCRRLVFLSFLAGLCWSSAVFVFWVDGQIQSYLTIVAILVGVSAVCLLIMSTFLMAMVLFYAGVLLPPLIHALLIPDGAGLTVAIGLTILFFLLMQYGSQVGMQLVSDLESTTRNEMLAERLHLALDAAHQDWFDINPQSGQMLASAKYAAPHGLVLDDAQNGLRNWLNLIHPDDRGATQSVFRGALQTGGAAQVEYRIRAPNGGWTWIRSIGRVVDRDADGHALRLIGIHSDISETKHLDDQIKLLAFYDHLTNLPNRRLLNDRLQHAIASADRHKRYGALLMLDLDDFKALNDSRGHDVGDMFLIEVARRIESCTRKTDTVARQGGDEFIVLLEFIGQTEAAALEAKSIAEKTLHAIRQPYLLKLTSASDTAHTHLYHCTASIGVTLFSDGSKSADELIKRADTAMYQAKASGRNAIRFFDLDMQEAATARAELDNELREAVQSHQFVLYYQPQVDAAGHMTGAEALLRWLHPRHGVVAPDRFISVTESNGLIVPIGRFVLETACAQLASWAARPETSHLTLSVNVSAVQFLDHEFMDHTRATVERSGINPRKLKLEITESLLLNNVEDIVEKMFQLKTRGIGFSLDDFGTGYSSMSYLKRLPIEQLKIDKSFIDDVLTDANDAVIARTIVALANSMGLAVIAEGVETDGQRQFLADNGCLAYQGYLYARPLPLEGFEQYARQLAATTPG
jgi:diguanylate cyclase (GGDEF)-like protein